MVSSGRPGPGRPLVLGVDIVHQLVFSHRTHQFNTLCSKMPLMTIHTQWRKKMFLNRGAVNKIVHKARKNFFGLHDTPSNHAHYANLAVK